MAQKQLVLTASPKGAFEFKNTNGIRGLEIRGRATEVSMFDASDTPITFVFKGMSQGEIDTFLESVSSNS